MITSIWCTHGCYWATMAAAKQLWHGVATMRSQHETCESCLWFPFLIWLTYSIFIASRRFCFIIELLSPFKARGDCSYSNRMVIWLWLRLMEGLKFLVELFLHVIYVSSWIYDYMLTNMHFLFVSYLLRKLGTHYSCFPLCWQLQINFAVVICKAEKEWVCQQQEAHQ